jgi:hypothetical protein
VESVDDEAIEVAAAAAAITTLRNHPHANLAASSMITNSKKKSRLSVPIQQASQSALLHHSMPLPQEPDIQNRIQSRPSLSSAEQDQVSETRLASLAQATVIGTQDPALLEVTQASEGATQSQLETRGSALESGFLPSLAAGSTRQESGSNSSTAGNTTHHGYSGPPPYGQYAYSDAQQNSYPSATPSITSQMAQMAQMEEYQFQNGVVSDSQHEFSAQPYPNDQSRFKVLYIYEAY